MSRKILFGATCVAWLCATPAEAYTVVNTTHGVGVHWDSQKVGLSLDPTSPSRTLSEAQIDAAFDAALATWTDLPEARIALFSQPEPTGANPAQINLVRFRTSDWPYQSNMLAYTQLYAQQATGVIQWAIIEINEHDHTFSVDGTKEHDDDPLFDLQAVLTHELGHFLGLGHSTDLQATMFAGTAPGDSHQRTPDDDNRAGVAAIYSTLDLPPVSAISGGTTPSTSSPTSPTTPTTPTTMKSPQAGGCSAVGTPLELSPFGTLLLLCCLAAFRRRLAR